MVLKQMDKKNKNTGCYLSLFKISLYVLKLKYNTYYMHQKIFKQLQYEYSTIQPNILFPQIKQNHNHQLHLKTLNSLKLKAKRASVVFQLKV